VPGGDVGVAHAVVLTSIIIEVIKLLQKVIWDSFCTVT
jgi:hypothetical protein